MSKFKKKKGGELPAISTASLPDIVFMLLFFFMVVTVLRDNNLLVKNELPKADQVEKLKKDRAVYIYAGKPSSSIENIGLALEEARRKLLPELQYKVYVALKVDKETNSGLVSDIKQVLRERNLLKIIYITTPGNDLGN